MDNIDELIKQLIEAVGMLRKHLGFASASFYRNRDVEKYKEALRAEFTAQQTLLDYARSARDEAVNFKNEVKEQLKNVVAEKNRAEKERDNYHAWYLEAKDKLDKKPLSKKPKRREELLRLRQDFEKLKHKHEKEMASDWPTIGCDND